MLSAPCDQDATLMVQNLYSERELSIKLLLGKETKTNISPFPCVFLSFILAPFPCSTTVLHQSEMPFYLYDDQNNPTKWIVERNYLEGNSLSGCMLPKVGDLALEKYEFKYD